MLFYASRSAKNETMHRKLISILEIRGRWSNINSNNSQPITKTANKRMRILDWAFYLFSTSHQVYLSVILFHSLLRCLCRQHFQYNKHFNCLLFVTVLRSISWECVKCKHSSLCACVRAWGRIWLFVCAQHTSQHYFYLHKRELKCIISGSLSG